MHKPKRVGTYTIEYSKMKNSQCHDETHPVYEYRGYFIARSYYIANHSNRLHFDIYKRFENGKLLEFDFDVNHEKGQKMLRAATINIDIYLSDRELYS